MSDTPETLAAVLAEYRADIPAMTSGELPHPTPEYLRILLDRVDAAAERERVKARHDAEIEWTRIGYDERKAEERPGNAAAMRDALEESRKFLLTNKHGYFESRLIPQIDAALSAPARNCDRLQTGDRLTDAVSALNAYANEEERKPVRLWNESDWRRFLDWFFAQAKQEGGAK